MRLSNTSLIKDLSVNDSIIAAINEMFNERSVSAFIECLVVDGFVGTCVQIEDDKLYTTTTTSYFIATQITGTDFVRVEYCGGSEMVWNR